MIDKYTQIIANEFSKNAEFMETTQQNVIGTGLSKAEAVSVIGKGMCYLAAKSLVGVMAPQFAHDILFAAIDSIDWEAAAESVFFKPNPELN